MGEAASEPLLEEINEYKRKISEKLSKYALEDIYNCDETGILNLYHYNNWFLNILIYILFISLALFWQLKLLKTLAQGPVTGTKKSKNRVTILLTCNATGEDKLKPLFIHKYKNPQASSIVWYSCWRFCSILLEQNCVD